MSEAGGILAGMSPDTGRRVVLNNSERNRVLDDLNGILARTSVISEHLEVAAARAGSDLSVWTETQLDSMMEAARALRRAVESAPLNG